MKLSKLNLCRLAIIFLPLLITCAVQQEEYADTILINGNVLTVNKAFLIAEGVAIKNGKILAVGSNKDIGKYQGKDSKVIDLQDATVVPGFIDSHADHLPKISGDDLRKISSDLIKELSAYGITTVHVPLNNLNYDKIKKLAEKGHLPVRVYAKRNDTTLKIPEIGLYDNLVTSRCIWLAYLDGAMQPRLAALLEPYSDREKESGKLRYKTEDLVKKGKKLVESGFQIMMKTIGDKAARQALDIIEGSLKDLKLGDYRPMIHRLQLVHKDDLPRLEKFGVVVTMPPGHCISDIPWAEKRLGAERIKYAYAWKTMAETASLGFETDGPIAPFGSDNVWKKPSTSQFNPLLSIYWAVSRTDHEGLPKGGWYPNECVSIETALKAFTINGAFNAFEEKIKGSIETGKLADLVVLSKNILKIPPKELLETRVLMTMLGGKIIYENKDK